MKKLLYCLFVIIIIATNEVLHTYIFSKQLIKYQDSGDDAQHRAVGWTQTHVCCN